MEGTPLYGGSTWCRETRRTPISCDVAGATKEINRVLLSPPGSRQPQSTVLHTVPCGPILGRWIFSARSNGGPGILPAQRLPSKTPVTFSVPDKFPPISREISLLIVKLPLTSPPT